MIIYENNVASNSLRPGIIFDRLLPSPKNEVADTIPTTCNVAVGWAEPMPILLLSISDVIKSLDVKFAFCLFLDF